MLEGIRKTSENVRALNDQILTTCWQLVSSTHGSAYIVKEIIKKNNTI